MEPPELAQLQILLERSAAGDAEARAELVAFAHPHMLKLAHAMLRYRFPDLAQHATDSVVNSAWPRLDRFLTDCRPTETLVFLRQVAIIFRHVLLDMVGAERRRAGDSAAAVRQDSSTFDPQKLAQWSEFHERAAQLPDDLREVFDLHYYLGLSQERIAEQLDLHPREVSRRWIRDAASAAGMAGRRSHLIGSCCYEAGRRRIGCQELIEPAISFTL